MTSRPDATGADVRPTPDLDRFGGIRWVRRTKGGLTAKEKRRLLGVVVAAQFDCPADAVVLDTLQRLMPDRKVIGQRAVELVWGLGAFHCITQQQAKQP